MTRSCAEATGDPRGQVQRRPVRADEPQAADSARASSARAATCAKSSASLESATRRSVPGSRRSSAPSASERGPIRTTPRRPRRKRPSSAGPGRTERRRGGDRHPRAREDHAMTTVTAGSSLEHPIGFNGAGSSCSCAMARSSYTPSTARPPAFAGAERAEKSTLSRIDLAASSADLSSGDDRHGGGHDPAIEVDLPHRPSVVVETTSAEIEADGLLGDQRYRTTSGEVTLPRGPGRSPSTPSRATSTSSPGRRGPHHPDGFRRRRDPGRHRALAAARARAATSSWPAVCRPRPFAIEPVREGLWLPPATCMEMATLWAT